MVSKGMLQWCVRLIEKAKLMVIHQFCLDFGSGLLANLFNSHSSIEHLKLNTKDLKDLLTNLLALLKEKHSRTVTYHLLLSLFYLSKEETFSVIMEECHYNDKIGEYLDLF